MKTDIGEKIGHLSNVLDISFQQIENHSDTKYINVIDNKSGDEIEVKIYECKDLMTNNVDENIEDVLPAHELTNQKYIIIYKNHTQFKEFQDMKKSERTKQKIKPLETKKEFIDFLEENTIPAFLGSMSDIEFEVDGANYLSNKIFNSDNITNNVLTSSIYEVNLWDMIELYQKNSNSLFSHNVRIPLNGTKFKLAMYYEALKVYDQVYSTIDKNKLTKLSYNDFGLIETTENFTNFNLKHNGITIAHNGKFDTSLKHIKIYDYKNASIINGAQTVSAIFSVYQDMKEVILNYSTDYNQQNIIDENEKVTEVDNVLKVVFNAMKVNLKVICYQNQEDLDAISFGLNNQAAVSEYDKHAKKSKQLSEKLKKVNSSISIIRSGERQTRFRISLINFIKYYLICENKPGESKNFNLLKVGKVVDDILTYDDTEMSNLASKIEYIIEVENTQVSKSLISEIKGYESDSEFTTFYMYARNYALSLSLKKYKNEIDEEQDITYLIKLVYEYWLKYSVERNKFDYQSEFKKDDFWNFIQEEVFPTIYSVSNYTIEEVEYWLKNTDYINLYYKFSASNNAKNINSLFIDSELNKEQTKLKNFRTMRANNGVLQESMPIGFFNESIKRNIGFTDDKYDVNEYDNEKEQELFSSHLKELCKEILFVFNFNGEKLISIIPILLADVLENKEEYGKKIIDNIASNFNEQTENFTKLKDDEFFHIRTKGRNSEDTIIYSTGARITKKAIWINKKNIQEVLDKKGLE